MKLKELLEVLQQAGWGLDRVRGSHHVFVHIQATRSVVVPIHGKEIPDFYAKAIMKQAARDLKKGN